MITPSSNALLGRALLTISALALIPVAPGQTGAGSTSVPVGLGQIEGRVINGRSGDYLETVRITIEGGSLQTFTDNFGQYRIAPVPAGEVRVTAFHTGFPAQTITVSVAGGQSARADFDLAGRETVRLSEFVVSTSKEMDGAAIAINEQRFAANMRNVVAANEFGPIADASVGDILKFLPGVAIEYDSGSVPRGVSLNGVPMDNVPITVNGFDLATAQNGRATQRMADLRYVSTNNLSRMEVVYSPTPESPGMALAGSVNLVTRSAFERSKPVFNYSVVMHVPDDEKHFDATPGPKLRSRKITPGLDFSYVVPVNKRFGLTLSANLSKIYHRQEIARNTWSGAGFATNGGTLPNTTPDLPYLSAYSMLDGPWEDVRYSAAMTLDYKLSANNRVSLSFQGVHLDIVRANRESAFNTGRVLPGFTRTSVSGGAAAGTINIQYNTPEITKTSYMPTLVFRHDGPLWKAEAGLGYAYAINREDITRNGFKSSTIRRTGVTISFARTAKVMLEYYFEGVGVFSVGAFRREFENFFGAVVSRPTPEFLALYGLDPAVYGRYDVSTQHNIAAPVRMEGYDFNYKQALTFLPPAARGVQVFANATSQRALGDESANFAGYIPRSASWGISLTRQKFNLGLNWNYRSANRQTRVLGTGIQPGTFIWGAERLFIDLNGEYHLGRRLSVFANLRNINNSPNDTERWAPGTPEIARLANRIQENAVWIFGVRGTY